MTKDIYLEMCEQLNQEPDINNMPLAFDDLLYQTQLSLQLFDFLPDDWDSFNGSYMGKNLTTLEFLLNSLNIDKSDWYYIIIFLNAIINVRVETVNKKIQSKMKLKGKK